jgi:integrase
MGRQVTISTSGSRSTRREPVTSQEQIGFVPSGDCSWDIVSDMSNRRFQRKGHLYKKGPSWIFRWYEDAKDITGRTVRVRPTKAIADATGPNKVSEKQAQRIAQEILDKLAANDIRPGALVLFSQFVEKRFIPDHVQMSLKPGGKDHYTYCLGHILPVFGREKIRDINRMMIQDFLNEKRRKLSPQTVQHLKNALSAVFRHAKRCDMWTGDLPTEGIITPRIDSAERKALTADQAARLVSCLHGQYSVLAALLLSTGLRIGEAAGLRWSRIDFEHGVITIAESWSREHGYQSPKTKSGIRLVPLPASLAPAIAALRKFAGPDDPVFTTTNGNPIDKRTAASSTLKPAAKRAGVPWCSWHTLRHTHATLTDGSLTDTERAKILGHSSTAMTMHYTHPQMERVRGVIDEIGAAILGNNRTTNSENIQ